MQNKCIPLHQENVAIHFLYQVQLKDRKVDSFIYLFIF